VVRTAGSSQKIISANSASSILLHLHAQCERGYALRRQQRRNEE
jgi:hypothetical protein